MSKEFAIVSFNFRVEVDVDSNRLKDQSYMNDKQIECHKLAREQMRSGVDDHPIIVSSTVDRLTC